jgi:hypothetical protein
MKRLIEYLKQQFTIHNVSNSGQLIIWCNNLDVLEKLCKEVYMTDGWDVKEPIRRKWNWKKFNYEYRFKLIKH